MRTRSAAFALITRVHGQQIEYLTRWDGRLKRLHLIGGRKSADAPESFRDCLIRGAGESLDLRSPDELDVAAHPTAHLRFEAPSEATGEPTAYEIAVYEATLRDAQVKARIGSNSSNFWIDSGRIVSGLAADGRPVSNTMRLILGKAGRLPRWERDPNALVVGVVGHRTISAETHYEIVPRVERIFKDLAEEFPDRPVRLLSSLAEGGDRRVTDIALRLGYTLHAAFPCPLPEYEAEFANAESIAEFRWLRSRAAQWFCFSGNGQATRTAADRFQQHETVGRFIVDHSDVLIALWDGRPSARAGSTAQTVLYAIAEQRHRRPLPLLRQIRVPRTPGAD